MRRSSLALVLSLAAVFLSGAVVGGFGYRIYSGPSVGATDRRSRPNPEEYRRRFMEMMKERVKVTPDQVVLLNEIMDRTRNRFHALDADARPKKQAIHKQQVEEINAILNETQQTEYAKLLEERAQRRKERERKGSNGHSRIR